MQKRVVQKTPEEIEREERKERREQERRERKEKKRREREEKQKRADESQKEDSESGNDFIIFCFLVVVVVLFVQTQISMQRVVFLPAVGALVMNSLGSIPY